MVNNAAIEVTDLFVNGAAGLWVDAGRGPVHTPEWSCPEPAVRELADRGSTRFQVLLHPNRHVSARIQPEVGKRPHQVCTELALLDVERDVGNDLDFAEGLLDVLQGDGTHFSDP